MRKSPRRRQDPGPRGNLRQPSHDRRGLDRQKRSDGPGPRRHRVHHQVIESERRQHAWRPSLRTRSTVGRSGRSIEEAPNISSIRDRETTGSKELHTGLWAENTTRDGPPRGPTRSADGDPFWGKVHLPWRQGKGPGSRFVVCRGVQRGRHHRGVRHRRCGGWSTTSGRTLGGGRRAQGSLWPHLTSGRIRRRREGGDGVAGDGLQPEESQAPSLHQQGSRRSLRSRRSRNSRIDFLQVLSPRLSSQVRERRRGKSSQEASTRMGSQERKRRTGSPTRRWLALEVSKPPRAQEC